MRYLARLLTFVSTLLFVSIGLAQLQNDACFRLEGSRMRGCVPMAKGEECGPPKPCPPCRYFLACGQYKAGVIIPKQDCVNWSTPKCYDTPDGRVCDPAICLQYVDNSYCRDETRICGYTPKDEPQSGFYSCEIYECAGCPAPPPGYKDCGTPFECPGTDSPCTGG